MESLRTLYKARFTDVLDYGIYLYKKHFRKIFIITLIFNIPVAVLLTVINPIFTNQYFNMLNDPTAVASNPQAIFSSVLTLYTMIFGVLALYGINTLTLRNVWEGSITKILYADVVLKEERSIRQVVRECFRQFGSLFLGRFLYGLIQYAVIFVIYIVAVAGVTGGVIVIFWTTISVMEPWLSVVLTVLSVIILLGIAFLIAVLVGSYFGRFWMFLPSVCIEQKKGGSAVGRCGSLGKKSLWLTGLTYITGTIFVSLLPGISSFALNSVSVISGEVDITLMKMGAVAIQLLSSVLQPLMTCILTALYITLRVRNEGLDLELSLWSIKKEEMEKTKRWITEAANASE